jgi:hypothetical protein
MKASVVIAVFVLACAVSFGLPPQAPQTQQAPQGAPKEHSMTGCLQKGADAGTFKLTNLEKGPQTVEIAESTPNLAPHVTHKVEITGTATTGKDPKAHTMKVTAVKMVSGTCP